MESLDRTSGPSSRLHILPPGRGGFQILRTKPPPVAPSYDGYTSGFTGLTDDRRLSRSGPRDDCKITRIYYGCSIVYIQDSGVKIGPRAPRGRRYVEGAVRTIVRVGKRPWIVVSHYPCAPLDITNIERTTRNSSNISSGHGGWENC